MYIYLPKLIITFSMYVYTLLYVVCIDSVDLNLYKLTNYIFKTLSFVINLFPFIYLTNVE